VFDKSLFDTVREEVGESLGLCAFLLTDHDGLVAARPDFIGPSCQAGDLVGEVGGEVAYKVGELLSVVDPEEEVKVIVQCHEAAYPDFVEALGAAEDAEEEVIELLAGTEKESRLDGAVCDLHEGASLRDEADAPGHGGAT
jgi:hypothetical protein